MPTPSKSQDYRRQCNGNAPANPQERFKVPEPSAQKRNEGGKCQNWNQGGRVINPASGCFAMRHESSKVCGGLAQRNSTGVSA